jgi:site-specific DNA recombinase
MSEERGRAVIYLRVSSSQQADKDYNAEGFSIPGQREACRREAEKLNAEIVEEYIDRGESAKTANRPALRAMLDRLGRGDIGYVIVHKVDRLARNRADDVEIVMRIRQAGAQLVSTSENIDETPSGLLLHGIMSSIAEFYSRNLAAEVIKGTTQKAKKGGTPFRAPIGYVNSRTIVDGREIRIITIDPERGPLVREAFYLYATGDYSLSELGAVLETRGLRSRPTRKVPAKVLGVNRLDGMLRNPYYMGVVRYNGKTYKGRHEPLVDEATFQRVQDMLDSKRQSGEKSWRHFHYLRGSLFCAECGKRLTYTQARGHGGLYEYFVCRGRQEGTCSQGHHRVAAVEAAVERHYASVELPEKRRESIRAGVAAQVVAIGGMATKKIGAARNDLARLEGEERKLLAAHYADQISAGLFAEEQARIRRERDGATQLIETLNVRHDKVLRALDVALALADRIQTAYCQAGPQERRLFNQAFFERLEVDAEEITGHTLAEPFARLCEAEPPVEDQTPDLEGLAAWDWTQDEARNGVSVGPCSGSSRARNARTPGPLSGARGSNVGSLVRLRGLEPPRGFPHEHLKLARIPDFATAAGKLESTGLGSSARRARLPLLARMSLPRRYRLGD